VSNVSPGRKLAELAMEMTKSYYIVTGRPEYYRISLDPSRRDSADLEDKPGGRIVVAITQGGFGLDVVDDERQAKERFLEHLFISAGLDLPRSAEVFDQYFELERADEFIDLDEEI
jgi:hypothetical protein